MAGSKPRPRSRTNTVTCSASTSTYTAITGAPEWRAALTIASCVASTSARSRSSSGHAPPTRTVSIGTPWRCSTSAAARFDRVAEIEVGVHRRSAEQPRTQLALLTAGQAHDRARVVGAALDHREGLQHRVVQVRGHLGALVGADALAALLDERVPEAPQPRPEDQAEPAEDHGDREEPLPDGPERTLRREERADAARRRARRRRRPAGPTPYRGAPGVVALRHTALAPDELADQLVDRSPLRPTIRAVPIAASTTGHTSASPNPSPIDFASSSTPSVTAPSAATCTTVVRASALARIRRHRPSPPSVGEEQPAGDVEHDAGAAREREHDEGEPHEVGLDVEVVAEAARHPGDELVPGPTGERRAGGGRRPVACCTSGSSSRAKVDARVRVDGSMIARPSA